MHMEGALVLKGNPSKYILLLLFWKGVEDQPHTPQQHFSILYYTSAIENTSKYQAKNTTNLF
jgi:hypothetical protein